MSITPATYAHVTGATRIDTSNPAMRMYIDLGAPIDGPLSAEIPNFPSKATAAEKYSEDITNAALTSTAYPSDVAGND
jgi:hypothetical protein